MRIPVRLWATIKTMVAADVNSVAAAADSLDARARDELTAHAADSSSAGLQHGSTEGQQLPAADADQQLHPHIMQRRMPKNFVGTGGARTTYLHVTGRRGAQQAYALKVKPLQLADGLLGLCSWQHAAMRRLQELVLWQHAPQSSTTALHRCVHCYILACQPLIEDCTCSGLRHAMKTLHCWVLLLQDEQLTPALQQELSQLEHFCFGSFFGQRVEPLRPVSFRSYQEELRWVAVPVPASRHCVQQ
jgi:hypothetical protein